MRGQRFKSIIAENLMAANPDLTNSLAMSVRKKLCWKCQQDKSPIGGHIKTFKGGPMKFVCKDCMDARKAAS